jgi:hypothetical protein
LLSAGYAADAVGRTPHGRATRNPSGVLGTLSRCPAEATAAVGLGAEYRVTGARMTGAALVAEDRVAHLMAVPNAHSQ